MLLARQGWRKAMAAGIGSGEWQLASSLVSLMSGGSGEWQLASGPV